MMTDTELPDSRIAAAMILDPATPERLVLQIGTVIAVTDLGQLRILTHGTTGGNSHYYQAELIERCAPGQGAGETFWFDPFGLVQIV